MTKNYQFQFSQKAEKEFATLDQSIRKRILKKLRDIEQQKNPLSIGKKLINTLNRYRYRIGDYRIIVTPKSNGTIIVLLILKIGHRREIYKGVI